MWERIYLDISGVKKRFFLLQNFFFSIFLYTFVIENLSVETENLYYLRMFQLLQMDWS